MNTENFHKDFCLNGKQFNSKNELLDYSKTINTSIYSFLTNWLDEKEFIKVNTSGSTGKPKRIQLKKEFMVNSALATGHYFYLPENTKALLCLSTDFIAGKMMLVRALVLGWHLDIVEPNSNPLNGIKKQYDFCAMVPMQLYNSIAHLHLIKQVIVGGGVISKEIQNKIESLKTEVFATYGMTETITHIAVRKLTNLRHAELVSASHYSILPNIKISKDARGCLVIDAPKLSDNKVVTNDLVEIISNEEFKWLGRYDTIVNSGGVKLIPEQIENKLSAVIDHRFFVIGILDDILGEKLVLVIESPKEDNVILNKVKSLPSLSKFEIPKDIYFIEKFIETDTKKVNRGKTLEKLAL